MKADIRSTRVLSGFGFQPRSEAGGVEVARLNQLLQSPSAVQGAKEPGCGAVGVDFHRDRVLGISGSASFGKFLVSALVEEIELTVGGDLDRVLEFVS